MDNCFDRICRLANMLGIDDTIGSCSLAELRGYAAGLMLLSDELMTTKNQLSPDYANGYALDLFCNMLGISSSFNEDEKRRIIKQKLKSKYGKYGISELVGGIDELGANAQLKYGDVYITLDDECDELIKELEQIIENYSSPTSIVYIEGSDYNYNIWDSKDYTFNAYDNLRLPFYILDQF